MDEAPRLPLWIKLAHTAFVAVLVPVYASRYGFGNFLWFSDVALLGSVAALWLEDALLASTLAVAVLGPELAWNVDLAGLMFAFPIAVYWPSHMLLKAVFPPAR